MATADRPLSSFITAYAAWMRDKQCLRGTITDEPEEEVIKWVRHELAEFQVPLGRAATWARAVNMQRLEFDEPELSPIGGLIPDEYQYMAMRHATVAGVGMALGCGLGKTLTASWLARYAARKKYASAKRLWIFCPLNAFGAWQRFLPDLECDFEQVRVLSNDSAHKYVGAENDGGVIIYDEAHEMGDATSRRTKAAHELRPSFDFSIALTGTLTHAGIEKCLSVMDLIVPGLSLFASRWKAGEHFRCLVKKQLSASKTVTSLEKPSGDAKEAFMEWLGRGIISLSKNSPEVQASVQIPEQKLYDTEVEQPWPRIEDEVVRIAEEIMEEEGELPHMQRVVHRLCRAGIATKLDWLLEQIVDDSPVVVFAHYRESLDFCGKALTDAGISFFRIDGDTEKEARPPLIDAFQRGERQVFILQTKAGGVGIDLFRAQVSVMLDHSWKAIDYAQALARTCRRGQEHACHHFDLYANALQRRIVQRIREAQDFDASVVEYQDMKRAYSSIQPTPHIITE